MVFYQLLMFATLILNAVAMETINETLMEHPPLVETHELIDPEITTTKLPTTTTTSTTTLTTVATTSAASTTKMLLNSTTPGASLKPERDVKTTLEPKIEAMMMMSTNCNSILENWLQLEWTALVERIASDSSGNFPDTFCELNNKEFNCDKQSKNSSDHSAIQKLAAIEAIKKDLCANGQKDLMTLVTSGSQCLANVTGLTKSCTGSKRDFKSAPEFFLRADAMNTAECKNLTQANGCITSGIKTLKNCSNDQKKIWEKIIHHLSPPSCDHAEASAAQHPHKNSAFSAFGNPMIFVFCLIVLKFISAA